MPYKFAWLALALVLVSALAGTLMILGDKPESPGTQALAASASAGGDGPCIDCHKDVTPNIVRDFEQSRMYAAGLRCDTCHGPEHTSAEDVEKARLPTPETCATCHPARVEEFSRGKHAQAWLAMQAMPATHYQPAELIAGRKGCGGCHKIGLKTEEEIRRLKAQGFEYGVASCDACHTRHAFSVAEAREPEACATCHMGFDHPQWEMWTTSKHGTRYTLKRQGVLPEGAAAPKCQTCHMPEGDHEVRTAWGFLAVRLPLPDDPQWAEDRVTILKALGVLNPETGEPTGRLDAVKAADVARLTEEAWQVEREKMLGTCSQCHSRSFAEEELRNADELIRQADHLLAEAIRTVAALYQDGILKKPDIYEFAYPDLLLFHEAATPIEQKLYKMFLEYRMRAFQGAFHANPDYAFWYGWAEMRSALTEIQAMAKELREKSQQTR
jgi:hypothetical protein